MGLLVSLALFAVIEATIRRRDYALGLVDERTAELEESLRSLKIAERQALQASYLKSQFLANMSHEIRTPMNGVLGMAQLVLTGNLEPDQRRRMLNLRETGQNLLNIINDILDFSKMEAGRLEVEEERFNLISVVERAVSLMASPARDKGLVLSLRMDIDTPRWVRGDSGRLRQILINLIGNAVKFTEQGSVTVDVSTRSAVGLGRLRFAVGDTGVGIDASLKAHLMEPFSQADASTTRVFGGTGLGLAICRQLVELMNGTLDFTSEPGLGTVFWFEVDLPAVDAPATSEAGGPSPGTDGSMPPGTESILAGGPAAPALAEATGVGNPVPTRVSATAPGTRILVVDDAEMNRLVGKGLLESVGYEVDCVSSGDEAIEAVGSGGYAAILMDCLMPVMDGYETTRRIRGLESPARDTPIIALTAAAMNGDRERCLAAGMDDYVSKPINLEVLSSVLARYHPAADEGAGDPTMRRRLDLIGSRLPADAFSRICRQILVATPDLIDQLGVAVHASDRDQAMQLAHKLKGSMSSIGAVRLSSLAQQVEIGDGDSQAILDEIDAEYRRARDVVVSLIPQGAGI